jgi:hypothetical protein
MKKTGTTACAAAIGLALAATPAIYGQNAVKIQISKSSAGSLASKPPGSALIGRPELSPATAGGDSATSVQDAQCARPGLTL